MDVSTISGTASKQFLTTSFTLFLTVFKRPNLGLLASPFAGHSSIVIVPFDSVVTGAGMASLGKGGF